MNVIFAGTPEFACPTLKALFESDHRIVGVLTQPDRPAGRGRKIRYSPVKQLAQQYDCPILQPNTLKSDEVIEQIQRLSCDVMVVVAYGLLLPERVLQIPTYGCLNVHASLLPRWRGAAPIQAAILHGDKQSGISIMQMEKGLDTGPVFLMQTCDILPTTTGQILHDQLANSGADALLSVLNNMTNPKPQDDSNASYAPKIAKSDAFIDWTKPAIDIIRQIHAFNPWPVAYSYLNDKTIRCWLADPAPILSDEKKKSGTIVNVNKQGIDVMTGSGELVRLTQLQLPGKQVLSVNDLINAHQNLFSVNQCFTSDLL